MFEHSSKYAGALIFSRLDSEHLLSTISAHPIELDGNYWATAEHYYQANKYPEGDNRQAVRAVSDPHEAHRLGNRWYKRKRPDFKKIKKVLMTRALYSKAVQHPSVAEYLLATGEQVLAENGLYDHYWGLGRDQRGDNQLGKIWMDIRQKLREKS